MYRVLPDGLVKNQKIYIIDENNDSIDDDEICSDVCAGLVKQQCKVRTCKTDLTYKVVTVYLSLQQY